MMKNLAAGKIPAQDHQQKKINSKQSDVICQQNLPIVVEKRRQFFRTKRKSNSVNLLGQLNVDKKYLQNLLKRPGTIKTLFFALTFIKKKNRVYIYIDNKISLVGHIIFQSQLTPAVLVLVVRRSLNFHITRI